MSAEQILTFPDGPIDAAAKSKLTVVASKPKQVVEHGDTTEPVSLQELFATFQKWYEIADEDRMVILFALAIAASHRADVNDPIWGIIIGASGGGKSELLRAFYGLSAAFPVANFTAKSLHSGWRGNGQKDDPSLFLKMDTKLVLISDLSALFTMRSDERTAALGMLREAYDGIYRGSKGNLGEVSLKARFSMLAASTPVIDEHTAEMALLGERFLRIRFHGQNRRAKASKALKNVAKVPQMRNELKLNVMRFFNGLGTPAQIADKFDRVTLLSSIEEEIVKVADFAARARSGVSRDRNHQVISFPVPEEAGRFVMQLAKLAKGSAVVHGRSEVTEKDLELIRRVALDSVPSIRQKILQELVLGGQQSIGQLKGFLGIPDQAVRRACEDLHMLGVIEQLRAKTTHWNT